MKNVPAENVIIRFIMILSEHLVRCDTDAVDFKNPWYTSNQLLNSYNLQHHGFSVKFGFNSEILTHLFGLKVVLIF